MHKIKSIIFTILLGMVTTLLPLEAGATAQPAGDELAKKWAQRSAAAAKRLVAPGLDACDTGVEGAFKAAKESLAGAFRSFELEIDISGNVLNVSYSYKGGKLASFEFYNLPGGWIARQRVGSKTLSVLVPDSNCALDLCTNDPFAVGPCPGDAPE